MSEVPSHLYRIVWNDPPELSDFLSNAAVGKSLPPHTSAEEERLWDGLSSYNRESRARQKGRGMPWLGKAFIAELRLSDDASIRVERTTKSRGHYTVWGDPTAVLGCVVRVVPIRTLPEQGTSP